MKSTTPKVLHSLAGRTLLGHVLHAVEELSPKNIRIVVGSGRERVEEHIAQISPKSKAIFQERRSGTGHATQLALEGVSASGTVLILAGDTPLLSADSLRQLVQAHLDGGHSATVLTAEHPDPTGYGRIIRDGSGDLIQIVEERDASDIEREIEEINSGVYVFDVKKLQSVIGELTNSNSQGELYLTDVIALLRKKGDRVVPILTPDFIEILGVNDRVQLAECAGLMRDQINDHWMREGVTFIDPTTTWIDSTVEISADVLIYPGSALEGDTKIATGAVIGPRTTLIDCTVEAGAHIKESYCSGAKVGQRAVVGPFAHLRIGAVLAADSRVGAYVEIQNSTLGQGSKVPHLSYVGDATIGIGTNIGAGTIFANYDGLEKHLTTIGDHVRIGSDTILIAPVTVGDGAYTAAGSAITEDVPSGSIAVARAEQRNVLGWVLRKRAGTKSAEVSEKSAKKGKSTS